MLSKTCYYTIGMLIKKFRIRAGKSQRALALEIAVSETTLSRWETDTSKPSPAHLKKLEERHDPECWEMSPDVSQTMMNAGVLRGLKAEVEALNTHIQLLSKFVGNIDLETI